MTLSEQITNALRYATALVRNRVDVEAPKNAEICRQYVETLEALLRQIAEQEKQHAIVRLAVPLEEDLSNRIDEMCQHLATGQGFTLNGIGQLLVDVQRRMAADWDEIGRERRQRIAAERQIADPPQTDEWRLKIARAFEVADWTQVYLNGGPPCFHLQEDEGTFCLRAQRWQGHGIMHDFQPMPLPDPPIADPSQSELQEIPLRACPACGAVERSGLPRLAEGRREG